MPPTYSQFMAEQPRQQAGRPAEYDEYRHPIEGDEWTGDMKRAVQDWRIAAERGRLL